MSVTQQINFVRALTKPNSGAFFIYLKKNYKIEADKVLATKIIGNLRRLENQIFIWKNKPLFQGSCNNFLYPKIIESKDFPLIKINDWLRNFF